ncbi:sensor domain-containing diguanylate cyclase [Aureimonas sp. AU40]|uniref:sensor domain-containing diguanylate cyclase n=1 Tax=Aureimonas sp. AU40 TaxID=1637747 RepID=UPI000A4A270F|nr:sensor domain-containing diguanylate cyclase [Aureimonas sp. AU40]
MLDMSDRLMALAEQTDALVGIYDPVGRLVYANAAYRRTYFVEPDETPLWTDLMRRNYHAKRGSCVSHPDFEHWLSSCLSRRGTKPSMIIESDLMDGRWLAITESTLPDGWMLFVACDVTHQHSSGRQVRQERDIAWKFAHTDELTGISNRRYVMSALAALLERGCPTDAPMGCLSLLDIDHFKQINDRFGHSTGDAVLVEIARRIPAVLRTCDAFGRLGGEEFMLILPHVTLEEGQATLTHVLAAISRPNLLAEDPAHIVTCSAGLTPIRPGDQLADLYSRADQALYSAKRTGRNRTVVSAACEA